MFEGCINLLSLPENISLWDTSNVIKMEYLFSKLMAINKIPDISNWNTNKVIDIQSLFHSCPFLQSLPYI